MVDLPPQIDSPDLTDEERAGLLVAHEYFVATGCAEWCIEDNDE
jgi:predicted chitinase